MRSPFPALLASLTLLASVLVPSLARAEDTLPVSLTLEAKEKTYTAGQMMPVKVTLKNESDKRIVLWNLNGSWGRDSYVFHVTLPDGTKLDALEMPRARLNNSPSGQALEPGETMSFDMYLDNLYEPRKEKGRETPVIVPLRDKLLAGKVTVSATHTSKRVIALDKLTSVKQLQDTLWFGTVTSEPLTVEIKAP